MARASQVSATLPDAPPPPRGLRPWLPLALTSLKPVHSPLQSPRLPLLSSLHPLGACVSGGLGSRHTHLPVTSGHQDGRWSLRTLDSRPPTRLSSIRVGTALVVIVTSPHLISGIDHHSFIHSFSRYSSRSYCCQGLCRVLEVVSL